MADDAFNHPDRSNEIYLWGLLQAHRVMADFVKENFTGHPKFHPQMVMFILETMVPWVEPEGVTSDCANISSQTVTIINLMSSVDAFHYCLCDL